MVAGADGLDCGGSDVAASALMTADHLFYTRALVGLARDDRLDVPQRWADMLGRYAELQYRAGRLTAAVFVEPHGSIPALRDPDGLGRERD
jgi:hypothetical protein